MTASDLPTDTTVQSPNAQSHYSKHIVVGILTLLA